MSGRCARWLWVFGALVGLVLGTGCWLPKWERGGGEKTVTVAPSARVATGLPETGNQADILGGLRARMEEAYRLKPDGRFLDAIREVERFLGEGGDGQVVAEFEGGAWQVSCDGRRVGVLPKLPDFGDGLGLIEAWVDARLSERPLALGLNTPDATLREIEEGLAGFFPRLLCGAGRQMNLAWNEHGGDRRLVEAGARLFTLLFFEQFDTLGGYDEVSAKALAFLALAKQLEVGLDPEWECLLALQLGYGNHAAALAEGLPSEAPIGLYVLRDGERLQEVAERPNSALLTRYLFLRYLATGDDVLRLAKHGKEMLKTEKGAPLPLYRAIMQANAYVMVQNVAPELPYHSVVEYREALPEGSAGELGVSELRSFMSGGGKHPLALTPAVVSLGKEAEQAFTGPILDGDGVRAFFEGYFVSGLAEYGLHTLYWSSSEQQAEQIAYYLEQSKADFVGGLSAWYRNLVEFHKGNGKPAVFCGRIGGMPRLGTPAVRRAYEAMEDYFAFGLPVTLDCVRQLAALIDTRPEGLALLSSMATRTLYDLNLAEECREGVLALTSHDWTAYDAWYADYRGDIDRLQELAETPGMWPRTKVRIVGYLAEQEGVSVQWVLNAYEELVSRHPDLWAAYAAYSGYLEEQERYGEVQTLMGRWLDQGVETAGLDEVEAHGTIARMYYVQGKCEEALGALAPVIESAKFSVVRLHTQILCELGRTREALERARFGVERFENSAWSLAELLAVLWETGAYAVAAEELVASAQTISWSNWHDVVWRRFFEVFEGDEERAGAAVRAMMDAGLAKVSDTGARALGYRLKANEMYEVALEMYGTFRKRFPRRRDLLISVYDTYKQAGRREEGVRWLKENVVGPSERNRTAWGYLQEKHYELLWEMIDDPRRAPGSDFVWLYRAVAAAKLGPEDPHYEDTIAYFSAPGQGYYYDLGRVLLGLAEEEVADSIVTNLDQACEYCCFMGMLAAEDRRFEDAVEWYRAAVETRRTNNIEHNFAARRLFLIYQQGKSLARLNVEGMGVSGFGFRVSGFGSRVSGLGSRVSSCAVVWADRRGNMRPAERHGATRTDTD